MNSTGQDGEKTGYRVILLLVVGLTAFSSAMKELNQVQQLTLDATSLIAHWSEKIAPAEIPQTAIKLETCDTEKTLQQSDPSVELPWLAQVREEFPEPDELAMKHVPNVIIKDRSAPKNRTKSSTFEFATVPRIDIDPVQLEVRISTDHDAEPGPAAIAPSDLPVVLFKARNRKHGAIKINPRDREMLLKTLNRSINLRIAS